MKKFKLQDKYESEWQARLKREPNEDFFYYERNSVLPFLFKKKEKLLDLACGSGIIGEYAQKNFNCQVTAIDISPTAIKEAKRRGLRAQVGSIEGKLPFKSHSFDTVFWGDNIEHIFYPEKVLHEIHRVLKPKGRVIISAPNQAYWRYRLYPLFTGALPKTEGEKNQPWEWTHIRFFTRIILRELLELTGFQEKSFFGVSRRKLDQPLLNWLPELFGMIMVVEAEKL